MKKITINNKQNTIISPNNLLEDSKLQSWLDDNINNNVFGKPQRWVKAKVLVPSLDVPEVLIDSYPDEVYSVDDVLETEYRNEFGESIEYVKLKADYTIEIEDITEQLTKDNRIKEIKALLLELDLKAIRPLIENESERIDEIKTQKLTLRNELNSLTN